MILYGSTHSPKPSRFIEVYLVFNNKQHKMRWPGHKYCIKINFYMDLSTLISGSMVK
jgi:hypothetical protein